MLKDEELIKKYRETKDGYLLEELFSRYKKVVLSKARRFYFIHGDVEDLVQEGMLGLYNAVSTFDSENKTSFKTYANVCIERKIVSAFRNFNRLKHKPLNSALDIDNNAEEVGKMSFVDPEDIVIANFHANWLKEKMGTVLSPFEISTLKLYLEGYDYLTIAEKLNKPPKSVDNALQRAKNKLTKYLAPYKTE